MCEVYQVIDKQRKVGEAGNEKERMMKQKVVEGCWQDEDEWYEET
jgi:hypothetical protein